ncbi:MAG: class I SAM-dependent methyltransferase [Terracidiphilus sp.]
MFPLPQWLSRSATILEVGCGQGTELLALRTLGFGRLVGVDASCERLRRVAAKLGSDARLELVVPENPLPFDGDCFDVVISAAVIEHTLDDRWEISERVNGEAMVGHR